MNKQCKKMLSLTTFGKERGSSSLLSKFVHGRRVLFNNLLDKSKFYRWNEISTDRYLFSKHFEKRRIEKNMEMVNKFLLNIESYFFSLDNYNWEKCIHYLDSSDMRKMVVIFSSEIESFYIVLDQMLLWKKEAADMLTLSKRLKMSTVHDDKNEFQPLLPPPKHIGNCCRNRSLSFP